MVYIRQLDSLRAIAILLVLICHWISPAAWINQWNLGSFGVNVFFVLSGFLITRILLVSRDEGTTKLKGIFNFYIRRMLRIFPIYYLTIIFIYLIRDRLNLKYGELYCAATFTINYFFYIKEFWGYLTVHFWSLAVEEQFYLVWPFIIFFLPRRCLIPAFIISILVSAVFQVRIENIEFGYLPTYTCADAFGFGALLSWIVSYYPEQLRRFFLPVLVVAILASILLAIQQYSGYLKHLPIRTMHSIIAVSVIWHLLLLEKKQGGIYKGFWTNSFLIFIGKISYGMYMYHMLVQWIGTSLMYSLQKRMGHLFILDLPGVFYLIEFMALVGVSYLSWKYIEEPIRNVKRFLPVK